MHESFRLRRVLAIDVASRGFGFAVLESPTRLVDWGTHRVHGAYRSEVLVAVVDRLIAEFAPDVLVLEEMARSPRGRRAREFIGSVRGMTQTRGLRIVSLTAATARRAAAGTESATRQSTATALADRFPPLRRRLPPATRKWYRSEYSQLPIFDAVAFAVAVLDRSRRAGRSRAGPRQ